MILKPELCRKNAPGVHRSLLAVVALTSACLLGCAAAPYYGPIPNPFSRRKPELERKYGPTPAQRVEQVRQLAQQAPSMSPPEKDRVSFELSQKCQNEVDPVLRAEIVRALGAFPTRPASTALNVALADNEKRVRLAAVDAWSRRGGPEAIHALGKTVREDADIDVRLAATRALGKFEGPQAAQALVAALDDDDPALQHRAVESLQVVSGQDYGTDYNAWRRYAYGVPSNRTNQPSWANNSQPYR